MKRTRPNVLFFLPDQWRPDFLGFAGVHPVRTPFIDRLAGRGTVFTRATTPSPLCAPARACLAAGVSYRRTPVRNNRENFPPDRPTLYSRLRETGYQTGSVGKLDLHKATLAWGTHGRRCMDEWGLMHGLDSEGKLDAVRSYLDSGRNPQGPYMGYLASRGLADVHARDFSERDPWLGTEPTPLPDDAYSDNWIAETGLHTLRKFDRGEPWFLAVNFTGPHNPQDITRSMASWCDRVDFPAAVANTIVAPALINTIRQNYAAMCENIDRWLGRYLDELSERGELDDTIVIFSSDHGEMLGDHDRWGKSIWHQASIGIPLVVAGPGVATGRREELVQLHDLTATLIDVAGADPLPDQDARSLLPLLSGQAAGHRSVAYSGLDAWESRWDGRWKLVLEDDAPVRLFDQAQDPAETNNLLGDDPVVGPLTPDARQAYESLLVGESTERHA